MAVVDGTRHATGGEWGAAGPGAWLSRIAAAPLSLALPPLHGGLKRLLDLQQCGVLTSWQTSTQLTFSICAITSGYSLSVRL